MSNLPPVKRHLMTVVLEDYFQVGAFKQVIQRDRWYRFETRFERNTQRTLELLDHYGIKATFFVVGWLADRYPELVRKVVERGHEVASKGYFHQSLRYMSREEFRDDALRSREALEHACGRKIIGFRIAHKWLRPQDLWALDILADLGFAYDSSIAPLGLRFKDEPWRRFLHKHVHNGHTMWELPISTTKCFGLHIPISGGNYLRQLPPTFMRRAIQHGAKHYASPLVFYFHAWELDPDQPKINSGSWISHLQHYRNLDKMQGYLEHLFERYKFTSIADYLKLSTTPDQTPEAFANRARRWIPEDRSFERKSRIALDPSRPRTPVSVVIPCYNEEPSLAYLANTLKSVERELSVDFNPTFILVNDGSSDGTWAAMKKNFGGKPGFELIQHERNRGVSAAIMTGIRAAKTEIVCSMDADCTYDPHELQHMIPLLRPGVDLVTASPYHPEGMVRNVPAWRLRLSKSASWMYRRVLHQKLYTFTSCFRVYRKSSVEHLELIHDGYLGIAELLGKLDLQHARIVEFPAVLEVRALGRSKMKTVRTILGHLKLMTRLFAMRCGNWLSRRFAPTPPTPIAPVVTFETARISFPESRGESIRPKVEESSMKLVSPS